MPKSCVVTAPPAQHGVPHNSTAPIGIPCSPLESAARNQALKGEYTHRFKLSGNAYQKHRPPRRTWFDRPDNALDTGVDKAIIFTLLTLKWFGKTFRRNFTTTLVVFALCVLMHTFLWWAIYVILITILGLLQGFANAHSSTLLHQPQRSILDTILEVVLGHTITTDKHITSSTHQTVTCLREFSTTPNSPSVQHFHKGTPTCQQQVPIPCAGDCCKTLLSCDNKTKPGYKSNRERTYTERAPSSPPDYYDVVRVDSAMVYGGPINNGSSFGAPCLAAPTNVPGATPLKSKDSNAVETPGNTSTATLGVNERQATLSPMLKYSLGAHLLIDTDKEIVQPEDTVQKSDTDSVNQSNYCNSTNSLGKMEEYQAGGPVPVLQLTSPPMFSADVSSTAIGQTAPTNTDYKVGGLWLRSPELFALPLPLLQLALPSTVPLIKELLSQVPDRSYTYRLPLPLKDKQDEGTKPFAQFYLFELQPSWLLFGASFSTNFGLEQNKPRWISYDSLAKTHNVISTRLCFKAISPWKRPSPTLDPYTVTCLQVNWLIGNFTGQLMHVDRLDPDPPRTSGTKPPGFPLRTRTGYCSNLCSQITLPLLPFRYGSLVASGLAEHSHRICNNVAMAGDQNYTMDYTLRENKYGSPKPTNQLRATLDGIRLRLEIPVSAIITPMQEPPATTDDIGGHGELNSGVVSGDTCRIAIRSSRSSLYIRGIKYHEPKGSSPPRWCRLMLRRLGGPKRSKSNSCLVSRPFYSLPSRVLRNARAHGDSVISGWVPDAMESGNISFDPTGFTDLPLELGLINGGVFGSGQDPGPGLFEAAQAQNDPLQALLDGIEPGPNIPIPQPQHHDGGDLPTQQLSNAPPPPVPLLSNLQYNPHGPAWNEGFVAGCKAALQAPGASHFQPHGDESDWNEGFVAGFTLASENIRNRLPSKTRTRSDSAETLMENALLPATSVSPANNTLLTQPTAGSSNQAALLFSRSAPPGLASQPVNHAPSASLSLGTVQTTCYNKTSDLIAPNDATPNQKPALRLEHTPCGSNSIQVSREKLKRHKCDKCDGTFARKYQLDDHKRKHSGQSTPHCCDFPGCGKVFSNRANMRRHQKLHTTVAHDNNVTEAQGAI